MTGTGESIQAAALRELIEETGHTLNDRSSLVSLGRFYALPSETNKYVNFSLAQGDTEIEKYFDMSTVEMPFEKALAEVGHTIHGIETAGALMLAGQHL